VRQQLFAPSTHAPRATDRAKILNKFAHKMKTTEVTAPTRDSKDYILLKVKEFEEWQRKKNQKPAKPKLPGAYEPWQRAVCGGHRISAGILNYLLALHAPGSKNDPDREFRFTADQISVQVFKGEECTRKTAGAALKRLVGYGLISMTRDGHRKLKGRYPDRAAIIHLKIETIEQRKMDFLEGKLTKKTGEKATPTWRNVTPSQTDGKQGVETHAQQVQTEKSTGDFPWGSVTPPSVSSTESFPPNPLGESENPTTDDSPSAMGTPFSTRYSFLKKKIPGSRSNLWNIASGEPVPAKDPILVAFSQNPWGMALLRLFRIPVLKHEDARDFFTALNNESFGVDEMLWLQLIHYPENKSPVLSGFGQMIDFAKSVQWRGYGTDDAGSEFKNMEKEMDRWLVPFYLTKPEEKRQFRDEIRLEMVNVQTPALYPEFLDQIATWADHWRFFVEVRDDYSKTASYKYPNRIVRNFYAAQEDDWQAQTESPAEPATAPASAPDCNPCSEIPDWAYDPQFRPYWQGDLPPRAETTTQDDDDDDDFPAWVLDHHAFNTAKN